MERRSFIKLTLVGSGLLALKPFLSASHAFATNEPITNIIKTEAEWKKILTPQQFDILRHEGTETPFSSPLNHEKRTGIFACVACALPLFPSQFKFDSGTGWPSFFDVIPGHIQTKTDKSLLMVRTEYHCARCNGHHGHLFDDGPEPTGLRYCSNGAALTFIPGKKS